jgi:hypothetical protein
MPKGMRVQVPPRALNPRSDVRLDRLRGRPAPVWILGDSADNFAPFRITPDAINANSGIRMEDYAVVDRRGRFVLLRKKN